MSEAPVEDTTPPADWRTDLGDLAAAPSLANFSNVGDLAKSFVELKSLQGDMIRIPGDSASDDARVSFRETLKTRVPSLLQVPDADDEAGWDEAFKRLGAKDEYTLGEGAENLQQLPAMAKAAKLTEKQFNRLAAHLAEDTKTANDQAAMTKATFAQELKTEWGAAVDAKTHRIMRMTELHGAPRELHDAIAAGDVPPSMLLFLDKVADQLAGEGSNLTDPATPPPMPYTPAQIDAEIQEVLNNPDYWVETAKNHKALKAKMLDLHGQRTTNR